jgi:Domain of unknown function (DUF4282)
MGDTMTDRSSSQDLPDDWSRGSYAARDRYYGTDTTDAYGAGTADPHQGKTADRFDAGDARPDSAGNADPFGAGTAHPDGVTIADLFGAVTAGPDSAGNADPFGAVTARPYGAGNADPFGAATARPYGAENANPFGARNDDPFGAATAEAHRTRTADPYDPGADGGTARADAKPPRALTGHSAPGEAADSKGFLSALFDFGFTSFVTPKVIKALYVLITIGTVVSALVFTVIAFKVSTAFGILTLIFGDPLFILIVLAIYRIILEFFVVTFRMAEDVQALRERGGPR